MGDLIPDQVSNPGIGSMNLSHWSTREVVPSLFVKKKKKIIVFYHANFFLFYILLYLV